jgi:hypothetical protein
LACLGAEGLRYVVLSPDAFLPGSAMSEAAPQFDGDIGQIVGMLVEHGVRPALGHFQKSSPSESARCIRRAVTAVKSLPGSRVSQLLTDHLFNDMPRRFVHSWRDTASRERRGRELEELHLAEWTLERLPEVVGEVPAALMQAAVAGDVVVCLNFDGEHVDLDICRRVVELLGPQSVIAMTDRLDIDRLAGVPLQRSQENSLWYQPSGIVAAGSSSIDLQMANIRSLGFNEADVWQMTAFQPARVLELDLSVGPGAPQRPCSYVRSGERFVIPA